ncbi:MAG: hypothetical protein CL678_04055 [Bdellovibrionaceae bacterium]|nr:hypothetical protein [Pseudobdellovibrionaceae bacterium]
MLAQRAAAFEGHLERHERVCADKVNLPYNPYLGHISVEMASDMLAGPAAVAALATLRVDEAKLEALCNNSATLYVWSPDAVTHELHMFTEARLALPLLPSMPKQKFRSLFALMAPYLSTGERAATALSRRRISARKTARKKAKNQKAAQRAVDAANRRLRRENDRLQKLNYRLRESLNATCAKLDIRPHPSLQ